MDFTKILEMLGAEKLDESQQTEIKEALETIIEAKAAALVETKLEESLTEEKEKLTEEFEGKFETYKDDITSKFSNFVDTILEEEMVIPEKIMRFARIGELYEDLIEQFKTRLAIDEGLVEEETKKVLKEAKDDIAKLTSDLNTAMGAKLELEKETNELANHVFLRTKCDGLTEGQRKSVMGILEGSSKEEIEKKFDIVVESISKGDGTEGSANEGTEGEGTEGEGTAMNESGSQTEANTEGEGTTQTSENVNPQRAMWLKMLREGKI